MLFTTLIRNLLLLFTVSLSLVFFVSCQREVEEILEESPPPDPDPSAKRLKAVYVLEDFGGWDTVTIFQYKYDGQGRLQAIEQKSQTDSYYVRLSLFYHGSDKNPYLVTDSSFENWSDPSIDSIFIYYDPLGRVSHDSSIYRATNMVSWPLKVLQSITARRFIYVNNSQIQVNRKWTTFSDDGSVLNVEGTDGTISILQNNADVFEQNYEEWEPGFPSSFNYYYKVDYSEFQNPSYGLLPSYPLVETDGHLPFGWDFPKIAARVWEDVNGTTGESRISVVESHQDSLPTRMRVDYYNVPGWVEIHLFEYE